MKKHFLFLLILFSIILSSCQNNAIKQETSTLAPSTTITATITPSPTFTSKPTITPTPQPTLTPTPDLPVSVNSYFPQPLSVINSENIDQMELLGIFGDGQLLSVELNDEKTLLTAVYNSKILSINTDTLETEHQIDVDIPLDTGINYQISTDGKYAAVIQATSLKVFDLSEGKEVFRVNFDRVDRRWFRDFDFSPDNKYFICLAGKDDKWGIWDLKKAKFVFIDWGVKPAFVPNGMLAFGYGNQFVIKNFDNIKDGDRGPDVFRKEFDEEIRSYSFSKNGTFMAVRMGDKKEVWNLRDDVKVFEIDDRHKYMPEFSPLEDFAYSLSRLDGTKYYFWRLSDGKMITVVGNLVSYEPLFSPDGSKFALVEYRNGIKSVLIYNSDTFYQTARIQFGDRTFGQFMMTDDGKYIVTYSMSHQRVRIIDMKEEKVISDIHGITNPDIYLIQNKYLIAPTNTGGAVYEIPSGNLLFETSSFISLPFVRGSVHAVDDELILFDESGILHAYSINEKVEVSSFTPVRPSRYYTAIENQDALTEWDEVLSEDMMESLFSLSNYAGGWNYSPSSEKHIRYRSGVIEVYEKLSSYTAEGFKNAIVTHEIEAPDINSNFLRLTPDGEYIIGISNGSELNYWSSETGELIRSLKMYDSIYEVLTSPRSDSLYLGFMRGSYDHGFKVLEIPTGNLIAMRSFSSKGSTSTVRNISCSNLKISLSKQGDFLVSMSENCAIGVYETDSFQEVQSIDLEPASGKQTAISSTGDVVAIAQSRSSTDFYDVDTGELIHSLAINEIASPSVDTPTFRINFINDGKLFAVSRGFTRGEILLFGVWE